MRFSFALFSRNIAWESRLEKLLTSIDARVTLCPFFFLEALAIRRLAPASAERLKNRADIT